MPRRGRAAAPEPLTHEVAGIADAGLARRPGPPRRRRQGQRAETAAAGLLSHSSRRFALFGAEPMLSGIEVPARRAAGPVTPNARGPTAVTDLPTLPGAPRSSVAARRARDARRPALRRLAVAAAWGLSAARARRSARRPAATEVSVEELMKPGPLPDLVLGKADAPITIVEYASMTCGHCASFHNTVCPALKEKYIDTGKVRLIMREFPLDNLAAAASMLARCAGDEQDLPAHLGAVRQAGGVGVRAKDDSVPELFKFAKQAGFTEESLRQVPDRSEAARRDHRRAARAPPMTFGVARRRPSSSTARSWRAASLEDFDKAFDAAPEELSEGALPRPLASCRRSLAARRLAGGAPARCRRSAACQTAEPAAPALPRRGHARTRPAFNPFCERPDHHVGRREVHRRTRPSPRS